MKFTNLKGDIFGGLTAGVVALPLALAFGVQSGLGASAGLYGAMFLGLFATILGGTNTQISGPTGPMTIVSAAIVANALARTGSLENAWPFIVITFLLGGIFQITFGLLKIGKYIKFIPYPVLSGFMSGIGIIIIVFQLFPAIGLQSPGKIVEVFSQLPASIQSANKASAGLTLLTLLIIYLLPKLSKIVPSTLVALILLSVISYIFSLDTPVIGEMPSGFPSLKISGLPGLHLADLKLIIIPAITLAGLGSIDSLLTSVVADNITRTKHKSNKELIGQGIGNVVSAVFGGIPGAGATMRTVVNVKSGGKSKLSGIIHSLFLVLVVLGIGKYVAFVPLAVLSGILISVGISIVDTKGLRNLFNIPKSDAVVLLIVLILTVFVDLLQAVGIGMVIASITFMRKASEMVEANASLTTISNLDRELAWEDEKNVSLNKDHVYIKRFDGPIFFGVASKVLDRINKIPSDARVIIFRMKKVPYIDQSGLYALIEVVMEMQKKGIVVVFTMTQDQPMYMFRKNKFIPDILPEKYLFSSIEDCAAWLKDYCKQFQDNDEA